MRISRFLLNLGVSALLVAAVSAPAMAQKEIRIGVLLPYSGVFGVLGKDQDAALELGLDTYGREVAGRPIVLVRGDTESKPNSGLAAAKKLILKDKVDMLVGVVSSAVAGAMRDYVHNAKVPFLIANAGNDQLTGAKCSPWIIRTSFSNSQINRPMGHWMALQGYRKVFLMAFDYAAGHQMMEAFRASFTEAGGTIVGEEYPPLGETKDFGPYLAKAKAANPDAVYVFFAGGPAIKFVKEYKAFGLKGKIPLAGAGWLTSALYVNKQGQDAAGILSTLNYVPSIKNPANRRFQSDFMAKHNRQGSEFGVAMYDTVRLIVKALERTGGKTDDRAKLVSEMHNVVFNGPRGLFRIDPETNNIVQNIYISEIKRGTDGKMMADIKQVVKAVQDAPNGCGLL